MRTSAIFPGNNKPDRPSAGFTLLELVVALAVMGLAMALVAPSGMRMVASWQERDEVHSVLREIAAIPAKVRRDKAAVTLDSSTSAEKVHELIPLPAGWEMELDQPLKIHASGACEQTDATLTTPHQELRLRIQTPFCHPILL